MAHDVAGLLGQSDELVWHEQAAGGVLPAHERLEGRDGARRGSGSTEVLETAVESHQGLVVQLQLVSLDDAMERPLQAATFLRACSQGRVVDEELSR